MSKKTGLWVLIVAIVAVAGGALYYWFEGRRAYQDFLAALDARGLTYEQIEENASGIITFTNPKLEVGQLTPVALSGFTFDKGEEEYDLILDQIAEIADFLQEITRRGMAYEAVERHESGTFTFAKPLLDVGLAEPATLGNLTGVKTQSGYDLTLEGLEIPLFSGEGKLAIGRTEIKALEFADKIDQTENGLVTAAYLSPFLHDKAQSIRLEGIEIVGQLISDPIKLLPTLTIGEILLENIDGGKVASLSDKEIAFVINIDSDDQAFKVGLRPNLMGASVERGKVQDLNLKRALEFIFIEAEDPDAAFEEIYSAAELDNYQILQYDGSQTIYGTLRASAGKMRAGKKAPAAVIQDLLAMQDIFTQGIKLENDPRVPILIDDAVSLFKMMGEQETVAEGIFQTYMIPQWGRLTITIAKIQTHLKSDRLDFSYHDMGIHTSTIYAKIGKIAMDDFSYLRMIEGLQKLFKNLLSVAAGEMQEKEAALSTFGLIPRVGQFSIEDFHLAGARNSPLKDQIGEWSWEHIRLTNSYDFEQAVIPTAIELEIKDLAVPAHIYRQMIKRTEPWDVLMTCMLERHDHVKMNYKIKTQWDKATQSLNFPDMVVGNNIFGTAGISVQLGKVPAEFFSFSPLMTEEEYREIRFKNLDITYDPQGQDAAFFACAGKEWDLGGDDVAFARDQLSRWFEEGVATVGGMGLIDPQFKPMSDAVAHFIKDGGKLGLSIKAKQEEGVRFDMLDRIINPFDLLQIDLQRLP